jgi:hypothetical protein
LPYSKIFVAEGTRRAGAISLFASNASALLLPHFFSHGGFLLVHGEDPPFAE